MLTISQLAAYCGVTVRAVRHYHRLGLLPEPPRDASGYRRYDAQAVIDLTRIKTLADAGVPLARVPAVLDASPAALDQTVTDLDAELSARIERLQAVRQRLKAVQAGDRLWLPEPVTAYLDRLRRLGLTSEQMTVERDGWVLLSALYPKRVPAWIDRKNQFLDDPEVAALYVDVHAACRWRPTDRRLRPLARRVALLARRHRDPPTAAADMAGDLQALQVVNDYSDTMSPAWSRLDQLARDELARQRRKE